MPELPDQLKNLVDLSVVAADVQEAVAKCWEVMSDAEKAGMASWPV